MTKAGEWTDCLVMVESGTIEVVGEAGSRGRFEAGDLLALTWLSVCGLHNPGPEEARLVAIRPLRRSDTPMKFLTVIELGGKTATGFRVPEEVVQALGSGKRPAVTVRIGPHTYRSTVAAYGDVYMLPLSAENREAAGVAAGDEVEVEVALDTAPRVIEVPDDLAAALDADARGATDLRRPLVQQPALSRGVGDGRQDAGDATTPHREVGRDPARGTASMTVTPATDRSG